jgi:hypothetical protein
MKNSVRAGVAALAFMGLVVQPIAANAAIPYCPPAPVASAGNATVPLLWGVGFFLCAGLAMGKQDVEGRTTHRDRARALITCAFPPIGLAKLIHHKPI